MKFHSVLLIFTLCVLLLAGPAAAADPPPAGTPDPYLDFARQLYEEGDYYRAVTEAKRFLFLNPASERSLEARELIARAEYDSGRYEEAKKAFAALAAQKEQPGVAARALVDLGRCLEKLDPAGDAIAFYKGMLREPGLPEGYADDLRNTARYRLGWLYLESGRWNDARQSFDAVEQGHPLKSSAIDLARRAPDGEKLKSRSPAAAGVMSAVLPGAGQLYAGRATDAGLAFALNAAFIWGAVEAFNDENWVVFGLLGLMETGWYGGNIYNAINGAHIYNDRQHADFLKKIRRDHGWRLGYSAREKGMALSWTTRY